jgi:hypothetical protein
VIEFGQAVSTAIGLVPSIKKTGLGFTDSELVDGPRERRSLSREKRVGIRQP